MRWLAGQDIGAGLGLNNSYGLDVRLLDSGAHQRRGVLLLVWSGMMGWNMWLVVAGCQYWRGDWLVDGGLGGVVAADAGKTIDRTRTGNVRRGMDGSS